MDYPPGSMGYELAAVNERLDEIEAATPWWGRWYVRRLRRQNERFAASFAARRNAAVERWLDSAI